MNPLLTDALGKIVRWGLTFLAGWFVQQGIWTKDNSTEYIAAAAAAILALGWSLWQGYTTRLKITTALAAPTAMSEQQLEQRIAMGGAADPTTKKHEVPS